MHTIPSRMKSKPRLVEFPSRALSSPCLPYHLVPRVLFDEVARRFELGAKKYGVGAWRKGLNDPEFLSERASHALAHLLAYLQGGGDPADTPMDNLAAVGWAVAVLMEAARIRRDAAALTMLLSEPVQPVQAVSRSRSHSLGGKRHATR